MNKVQNKNEEAKTEANDLKTGAANNQPEVIAEYEQVTASAMDVLATRNKQTLEKGSFVY